jgi:hypothetical protein
MAELAGSIVEHMPADLNPISPNSPMSTSSCRATTSETPSRQASTSSSTGLRYRPPPTAEAEGTGSTLGVAS